MSLVLSFPPGSVSPTIHEFPVQSWSTLQIICDSFGIQPPVLDGIINQCRNAASPAFAKEQLQESKKHVKCLQETMQGEQSGLP